MEGRGQQNGDGPASRISRPERARFGIGLIGVAAAAAGFFMLEPLWLADTALVVGLGGGELLGRIVYRRMTRTDMPPTKPKRQR